MTFSGRAVDSLVSEVERDRSTAAEKARQIEVDRVLLAELESVRGSRVDHRDLKRTDAEYADVFRRAGLDLDATAARGGRQVAGVADRPDRDGRLPRRLGLRPAEASGRPEADWRRLVAAARGGDPDPWRDALRAKFGSNDAEAVAEFRRLADDPRLEDQPAAGLLLLARQLKFGCGDGARAAAGPAAGRAPLSGRLPHPFRAGLRPRRRAWNRMRRRIDLFPDPEEAVRHLTAAVGDSPGEASPPTSSSACLAREPGSSNEAVGRVPRGGPTQARRPDGPLRTSATPCAGRGSTTKPGRSSRGGPPQARRRLGSTIPGGLP